MTYYFFYILLYGSIYNLKFIFILSKKNYLKKKVIKMVNKLEKMEESWSDINEEYLRCIIDECKMKVNSII